MLEVGKQSVDSKTSQNMSRFTSVKQRISQKKFRVKNLSKTICGAVAM